MTKEADLGATFRAGRVVMNALFTRTGPHAPRRWPLTAILLAGAIGVGAGAGAAMTGNAASDMPATDRARIEAVMRDYILAHPEILPEAMERLRANEMSKAVSDNRKDIETPYPGAWDGAPDGDVTLVEFFDYSCGYCRAAAPAIARLLAEDAKLKVVYRELPILGEESVQAARVALLAADSGRYAAFHKAMYARDGVTKAAILDAAAAAGLDKAKAQAALGSRGGSDEFAKNVTLAQALNARGTPLFVVGDQVLHGDVGYDALKAAIARKRSGGKGV